jgi:hypothetical protein
MIVIVVITAGATVMDIMVVTGIMGIMVMVMAMVTAATAMDIMDMATVVTLVMVMAMEATAMVMALDIMVTVIMEAITGIKIHARTRIRGVIPEIHHSQRKMARCLEYLEQYLPVHRLYLPVTGQVAKRSEVP